MASFQNNFGRAPKLTIVILSRLVLEVRVSCGLRIDWVIHLTDKGYAAEPKGGEWMLISYLPSIIPAAC